MEARVNERFSLPCGGDHGFPVVPVGEETGSEPPLDLAAHSPLGKHCLTTVGSRRGEHLGRAPGLAEGPLPAALSWATGGNPAGRDEYSEPSLIFADKFDTYSRATLNDFMVEVPGSPGATKEISSTLLEVVAHKRSRLFGFALANRFVNVMLPPAVLRPEEAAADFWFLQPLVSFVRGELDRHRLRSTFALSVFLIPVVDENATDLRLMAPEEIKAMVDAGWGYAAAPPHRRPLFSATGHLLSYLSRLSRFDLHGMQPLERKDASALDALKEKDSRNPLTLREMVEKVAFGVELSVGQGRSGHAGLRAMHFIGNDVIMALGSARVSSVVAVAELKDGEVTAPVKGPRPFPYALASLMESLAKPLRAPLPSDPEGRKYRLDRPFYDHDIYAVGVIPTKRCLVVVSDREAQWGSRESALMQAGSVAYMTLGAATAIGTMREIDRQLERIGDSDPKKIARIDGEIAADLNEIYDLDITRESYREMYRRLRTHLGIKRDYKTLQDKMETLYRATSTVHEHKAGRLLEWLTAAIVVLSVLILIGTAIVAGKPG